MSNQPSPTNLSDELDELIAKYDDYMECEEYHVHDGTREHEGETPLPHDFDSEQLKAAITAAYAEAIRSAVPEKKTVNWQNADSVESIASQSENYGFNAAIDTFTANLQKEGLLPTNGSDGGGAE